MTLWHFTAFTLVTTCIATTGFVPTLKKQAGAKPPITIVTDYSWDVSGQQTQFGEYPLSAELVASASSPLYGGTYKAVAADMNHRSQIVSGSVPIWRNQTADGEGEAYQFRKTVPLGPDPIQKITLQVSCDDVARIYINKRLVSVDDRNGKMKDGYDKWFFFRNVTGFTYSRIYTYDVTDYFFANVENTIFVEAVSLAFDGSHAYISAKIVIEFAPMPEPKRPPPSASKRKLVVEPKATVQEGTPAFAEAMAGKEKPAFAEATAGKEKPAFAEATAVGKEKPAFAEATAGKEKTIFEAGRDPEIEKWRIGSILELGHVNFKVNDYKLDTASYRTLAALATVLKRYPSLKIEVGGHTNLLPNDQFAAELSTNRARSVMRYLTDNGIAANRVTAKGYGKTQPRVNAKSKEADRANQRVEVKVLEK